MSPTRTGTRRWRSLRLEVFHEAGWTCEKCGRAGALECDHIRPRRKGGPAWERRNLQALCRGCHIRKTRGENTSPDNLAWRSYLEELAKTTTQGVKYDGH